MISKVVERNEAGQRSDKFLRKLFPLAPSSLIYKWLRKKSITCNGKKMDGSEKLTEGDLLCFYLSEETYFKFQKETETSKSDFSEYKKWTSKMPVVYRDENVLFLNKPAGILSQKDEHYDYSVTDFVRDYVLVNRLYSEEDLRTFHPAACNRLDRNTSGLILCGISLAGLQGLSSLISERSLTKQYRAIVSGSFRKPQGILTGYHQKDRKNNQVAITDPKFFSSLKEAEEERKNAEERIRGEQLSGVRFAMTGYRILEEIKNSYGSYSMVEVTLYTGLSHQIRAHFSSISHPLLGDLKYTRPVQKGKGPSSGREASRQMLHAERLIIPEEVTILPELSGKTFTADLPKDMQKLWKDLKGEQ